MGQCSHPHFPKAEAVSMQMKVEVAVFIIPNQIQKQFIHSNQSSIDWEQISSQERKH